ncbi:zinc transporter ZIP4 [Stigmatopora argus]
MNFCPTLLFFLSALAAVTACPSAAAVEEAFAAVSGVLQASRADSYLSRESLVTLFNTLESRVHCAGRVSCGKCNLANAVHQLTHIGKTHQRQGSEDKDGVDASAIGALAAGCVLYLTSPEAACVAAARGAWGEEAERFLDGLQSGNPHRRRRGDDGPCHGSERWHVDLSGLDAVLGGILQHYESADVESCVTASDIMSEVGAPSEAQTRVAGAVLGRVLYHALRGRCFRTLPEESFFLDHLMQRLGSENFTIADLEALMRTLNVGPDSRLSHGEDGHEHHRRRAGANGTWEQYCFSARELVLIHHPGATSPVLGRSDAARLSPALIQQILSGACGAQPPTKADDLSKTERYLYATLANVVVTLASMFGVTLLLCTSCTTVFQLCIQFCISLAVGSLTGDALLHLLPMFLGLHSHEADGGAAGGLRHDLHGSSPLADHVGKMLVVLAGIYYFYLMETIFEIIMHQHHGHRDEADVHRCDHGRVLEMYQQEAQQKRTEKLQSISTADLVNEEDFQVKARREQKLLPYMVTLGDAIHNFADGLAMGAAFSLSWKSGLSTSLAVLCHELPHELGDFAILLHSGLSVRRALLLNVGSAATSFAGLYIALSFATDLAAMQWIAAVTAGLFLYVGLADMLPTMTHTRSKRPWLTFALQNVGLLSGWSILLLLSLYEENISL